MEENWMASMTFEVTMKITEEDVEEIMVTALEGGCNYWCSECNKIGDMTYGDPIKAPDSRAVHIARGGELEMFVEEPFEEDENGADKKRYVLTRDKLTEGIKRVIDDLGVAMFFFNGEMDCSYVDVDIADSMVQYALFGEIVYG